MANFNIDYLVVAGGGGGASGYGASGAGGGAGELGRGTPEPFWRHSTHWNGMQVRSPRETMFLYHRSWLESAYMAAFSPQWRQGPRIGGPRWWPMSEGAMACSWRKLVWCDE